MRGFVGQATDTFRRQDADIACVVDNGNDFGVDGQLCRPEHRRITAQCLKNLGK